MEDPSGWTDRGAKEKLNGGVGRKIPEQVFFFSLSFSLPLSTSLLGREYIKAMEVLVGNVRLKTRLQAALKVKTKDIFTRNLVAFSMVEGRG